MGAVKIEDLPLSKQKQIRDRLDYGVLDARAKLSVKPIKKVAVDSIMGTADQEPGHPSKKAWIQFGEKMYSMRSSWERNFARYLQWQKDHGEIADWFYEPQRFRFEDIRRGAYDYLPDFKVIEKTGEHYWVEIKGYMTQKDRTRMKRFLQYFPAERLLIIDKQAYRDLARDLKNLILGWESA